MASPEAFEKIEEIAAADGRYLPAAYLFVLRCIEHARQRLTREGHVSGQELVESARLLALSEFGPMAKAVLNHWGVEKTDDFGAIVFQMIEQALLSKTPEDTPDDFRDRFDFETEFVQKYRW